jgi:hypothetical protein
MPVFLWSLYATSVILVLGTPVLAMTLLLLAFERIFHIGVFDPALGGDPLLFQHLFWFYSHPAVYIMILRGFGVISEIVPAFAHKRLFGYKFVVWCSIAIAVISFLVWLPPLMADVGAAFGYAGDRVRRELPAARPVCPAARSDPRRADGWGGRDGLYGGRTGPRNHSSFRRRRSALAEHPARLGQLGPADTN